MALQKNRNKNPGNHLLSIISKTKEDIDILRNLSQFTLLQIPMICVEFGIVVLCYEFIFDEHLTLVTSNFKNYQIQFYPF